MSINLHDFVAVLVHIFNKICMLHKFIKIEICISLFLLSTVFVYFIS